MKKLRVTVDGKAYEVLVEILDKGPESPAPRRPAWSAPATVAPAPVAQPAASAAAAAPGEVPSPLAGKVVSLDVAAGASVKAGDQILTLEAMKMNTIIYAPASGTLTAFCVNPGDTVQEGQALAKIG